MPHGAREVQRRLAAQPRATAEAAAAEAAQEAAARQVQELAAQARALARQARALAQAARARAQPGRRRRDQRERHRRLGAPLVARSWRAVTPGQREAPTPTTSPGYAREPRAARLPWTAPQWRPSTSPSTPTREGLRRPGLLGAEPLTLFSNGLAAPQSRSWQLGQLLWPFRWPR